MKRTKAGFKINQTACKQWKCSDAEVEQFPQSPLKNTTTRSGPLWVWRSSGDPRAAMHHDCGFSPYQRGCVNPFATVRLGESARGRGTDQHHRAHVHLLRRQLPQRSHAQGVPGRPMSRPSTTGVAPVRCRATISSACPSCHGRAARSGCRRPAPDPLQRPDPDVFR